MLSSICIVNKTFYELCELCNFIVFLQPSIEGTSHPPDASVSSKNLLDETPSCVKMHSRELVKCSHFFSSIKLLVLRFESLEYRTMLIKYRTISLFEPVRERATTVSRLLMEAYLE